MCTAFSRLQNWNFNKMSKEKREGIINAGREHLKFCMLLYRIQHENGMYFLHEHPHSATSWGMPEVKEVMGLEGVEMVKGDMCAFGMYQDTEEGEKLVMKPTGFMTNAEELGKELNVQCDGNHKHVTLVNGRAKKAQVYPDELCFKIITGLLRQMKRDGRISEGGIGMVMAEDEAHAWDDVTGEELNGAMVKAARKEEIELMKKRPIWGLAPIEECWETTNKAPVSVRWVDTNKGG